MRGNDSSVQSGSSSSTASSISTSLSENRILTGTKSSRSYAPLGPSKSLGSLSDAPDSPATPTRERPSSARSPRSQGETLAFNIFSANLQKHNEKVDELNQKFKNLLEKFGPLINDVMNTQRNQGELFKQQTDTQKHQKEMIEQQTKLIVRLGQIFDTITSSKESEQLQEDEKDTAKLKNSKSALYTPPKALPTAPIIARVKALMNERSETGSDRQNSPTSYDEDSPIEQEPDSYREDVSNTQTTHSSTAASTTASLTTTSVTTSSQTVEPPAPLEALHEENKEKPLSSGHSQAVVGAALEVEAAPSTVFKPLQTASQVRCLKRQYLGFRGKLSSSLSDNTSLILAAGGVALSALCYFDPNYIFNVFDYKLPAIPVILAGTGILYLAETFKVGFNHGKTDGNALFSLFKCVSSACTLGIVIPTCTYFMNSLFMPPEAEAFNRNPQAAAQTGLNTSSILMCIFGFSVTLKFSSQIIAGISELCGEAYSSICARNTANTANVRS